MHFACIVLGPGCDPSVRVRGKKRGGLKEERGENGQTGRVSDGRRQVSGGGFLGGPGRVRFSISGEWEWLPGGIRLYWLL